MILRLSVTLYYDMIFIIKGANGELGQGSETDYRYPPDPISLNADFVPIQIVAATSHTCSLSVDGRVACFGYVYIAYAARFCTNSVHLHLNARVSK